MVKSMDIKTPFSFSKTIFMPANLDEDSERLIASHEKAHIAHHHYVDVLVSEFVTRILWFNPFVWIARNELRNVHEFEADHEVITKGANIKNYQTTLLEMVLNESTPVVSGFSHSFIRRRFIEMRKSTAGTLGKIGKAFSALSIAGLFCAFTFTSCKDLGSADPITTEFQPGWFVINGTVDPEITDSAYNVYLGDKYQHITKTPDTSVVVTNKKWEYKVYLEAPRAAKIAAIFPGGEVCEATVAFTAIPGDTLCLNVHNGYYDIEGTGIKFHKDSQLALLAMRESTDGKTPNLPEIKCKKMWKKVGYNRGGYSICDALTLKLSEVYFTDSATILKLTTNDATGNVTFGNRYNLVDKNGNMYKFLHTTISDPTGNWDKEARVYGDYIYFEPLPMDTEEFGITTSSNSELPKLWDNIHDMTGKPDPEPNITVNIKVDDDADVTRLQLANRTDVFFDEKDIKKNASKAYPLYINAIREYGYLSVYTKNMGIMEYDVTLIEDLEVEITIHKDDVELNGTGYYAEWNEAYTFYKDLLKKESPEKAKEKYTEFLIKKLEKEKFGGCFDYSFNSMSIFSHDEARELIEKSRVVKITESPAQ